MVRHAKGDVIVLVDSSKIGIVADVSICPIERIDVVIVDDGIDAEIRGELEDLGVTVVVA
jgi:DeoR/GlpR family transcriptional regulator of sugar metabolism